MHSPRLALLLLAALTAASTGLAQKAPNKWIIQKFDVNKNGVLDPDETAAWQADEARKAAAKAGTPAAAPAAPKSPSAPTGLAPAAPALPPPAAPINPWVLKKYDANQNGVLDPDELAVQQADREADAAKRLAADLALYDANKNGKMDPEERAAKNAAEKAKREEANAAAAAELAKYDANANGRWDADEILKRDDERAAAARTNPAPPHPTTLLPALVTTDAKGRLVPRPAPAPDTLRNPSPGDAWLDAYRSRADYVLRTSLTQEFRHNTYFENEKYTLGQAMARVVAGDQGNALIKLSEPDANAKDWNAITAGIDYYAAFVIKHQPRRYFHFGPVLPPAYVAQMKEGARLWTEIEPLGRPNPSFQSKKEGWDPQAKNSWVDGRTTDNLSMMRFTAVYLFAEESGSASVTAAYKNRLTRWSTAMFRAGIGEWDSENYLGHTITPVFNIHDFAKDPEVRATGKAMLDWLYASLAVKYYRGGANGPNARDYNHVQPFQGGSLGETGWLFFGAPVQPKKFEYDLIHPITSAYTPPPAIIALGTQNFERPRELLNTKAFYHNPQAGDFHKEAAYHETYYYGRTFAYGSLAQGTSVGVSDINGFKLLMDDATRGVADFRLAPTADPLFTGSALYKDGKIPHPNRVGQNRNVALWLAKGNATPWRASLPPTLRTEVEGGITFIRGDSTWIALTPINMPALAADPAGTDTLQNVTWTEKKTVRVPNPETGKTEPQTITREVTGPRHAGYQALASQAAPDSGFNGLAIEIGEVPDFASYEAFKKAVLASAKLDVTALASGEVGYTGAGGASVKVRWGDTLGEFHVWRNDELHNWAEHGLYVYRETGKGAEGLIHQKRGIEGGTLTVNAGGKTFVGAVSPEGAYTFENR